ncbi:MAG: TatD family hydrolase [Alphaproteobacteria bacterium]
MFTDSHCHINAADFADDREETVQRAREMQITYILDVCDDIADMPRLLDFCAKHKQIYTTAGVHPELEYKYPDFTAEQILEQAKSPYVVGVGECGLDYYYNADIKEQQLKVLAEHIKAAQLSGLPLIIHNRESDDDMMALLGEAYKKQKFKGELHCFSSSEKLLEFALSIGFYISASGIITFKKSEELRQMFKNVPNDRLLIETDSPYLAPVPHRGQRNEPAFVVNTAQVLAELKNMAVADLAELTTNNFLALFNKVKADE